MVKLIICISSVVFLLLNTSCNSKTLKGTNQGYRKYTEQRSFEEKLRDEENEKEINKARASTTENEKAIKEFNEKVQYKNPDKKD